MIMEGRTGMDTSKAQTDKSAKSSMLTKSMSDVGMNQGTANTASSLESGKDEMLHEMHRQLKAASKVVINLKTKLEELSHQNMILSDSERKLQTKISSLETQLQEQRVVLMTQVEELQKECKRLRESEILNKSTTNLQEHSEDSASVADANKKVRLAQEQMAKVMAKDRKEIQEWANKCRSLEIALTTSKVTFINTMI
jgi:chromosome segregation ATPase